MRDGEYKQVTFCEFYAKAFKQAIKSAWHLSHTVHLLAILIEGGLFWLGMELEKQEHLGKYHLATTLPLLALVGALLVGMVWQAYAIYLQEHKERSILENKITQEKKAVRMSATQLWELFRTD